MVAGLLDVGWAISMKYAEGYTRLGWTLVSLLLLAAFVFLLGRALQVLGVGVAYTVWTGIGAVGAFAVGVLVLGESAGALRLAAAAMILGGLALMKLCLLYTSRCV